MENNEIESTNSSALGEFSVLTPSQKRALEKAEEEKRQKEADKKQKRKMTQLEKERKIKAKRRAYVVGIPLALVCLILFGVCLFNSVDTNGTISHLLSILFGAGFVGVSIYLINKSEGY